MGGRYYFLSCFVCHVPPLLVLCKIITFISRPTDVNVRARTHPCLRLVIEGLEGLWRMWINLHGWAHISIHYQRNMCGEGCDITSMYFLSTLTFSGEKVLSFFFKQK